MEGGRFRGLSALFDDPDNWDHEKWLQYFKTYLAFMTAEQMSEASQRTGMNAKELIAAIESFILALIYHDKTIASNDELMSRRAHFLNAVKGMQNYAKIIQMDRVEVVRINKKKQ
jgi:urease gamma subunit